jgi:hypothetical protein
MLTLPDSYTTRCAPSDQIAKRPHDAPTLQTSTSSMTSLVPLPRAIILASNATAASVGSDFRRQETDDADVVDPSQWLDLLSDKAGELSARYQNRSQSDVLNQVFALQRALATAQDRWEGCREDIPSRRQKGVSVLLKDTLLAALDVERQRIRLHQRETGENHIGVNQACICAKNTIRALQYNTRHEAKEWKGHVCICYALGMSHPSVNPQHIDMGSYVTAITSCINDFQTLWTNSISGEDSIFNGLVRFWVRITVKLHCLAHTYYCTNSSK